MGLIHSLPWWPGKLGSTWMSVFNGASPSITILLQTITNECILWCSAGAKGLQELLAGSLVVGWFFLSFCWCSLSLSLWLVSLALCLTITGHVSCGKGYLLWSSVSLREGGSSPSFLLFFFFSLKEMMRNSLPCSRKKKEWLSNKKKRMERIWKKKKGSDPWLSIAC